MKVFVDYAVDAPPNRDISLRLMRFDASANITIVEQVQTRPSNNFTGGRDVAFFTMEADINMDANDYVVPRGSQPRQYRKHNR